MIMALLLATAGIGSATHYQSATTFRGNVDLNGNDILNAVMGDSLPYNLVGTGPHCDYIVDGTSDETEINQAISTGKPVQFEPGVTFHIDGKILPVNGTVIRGNGAIISREMNDSAIWADGKTNISLSDFIIDANEETYTLQYQHPLWIVNSTYIWLDKIFVVGSSNYANGICIGSMNGVVDAETNLASYIWITRCAAIGCNGDSLYIYNADYVTVDSFVSDGSGISAVDFFGSDYVIATGISARGSGATNYPVNIDKCEYSEFDVVVDCNGGYPGIYITNGDSNTISGTIGGVSAGHDAIILGKTNNTTIHDMVINGGSISIAGGDRNIITDTIINCGNISNHGISVHTAATNTMISGVSIIDPINYGVYSDSCTVRVIGCEIRDAIYGIYLAGTAAGGASYSQIIGNRIDGSIIYGIYGPDNAEANADLYVMVSGNTITNSGTNSIKTIAYSDYWMIHGNILGGDAADLAGANNLVSDNIA